MLNLNIYVLLNAKFKYLLVSWICIIHTRIRAIL